MPYIYSVAGAVTQHDQTRMRPLVMDFADDAKARELPDEYMFGPALLVAPVTTYEARSREVYLPAGNRWLSLNDGASFVGGRYIDSPAAYDEMPVFVRAGSIVPTGPEQQWIGERSAETLTLHVYAGADGDFTPYEDQGTTLDYEKGAFSEVQFHWDDAQAVEHRGPQGRVSGHDRAPYLSGAPRDFGSTARLAVNRKSVPHRLRRKGRDYISPIE